MCGNVSTLQKWHRQEKFTCAGPATSKSLYGGSLLFLCPPGRCGKTGLPAEHVEAPRLVLACSQTLFIYHCNVVPCVWCNTLIRRTVEALNAKVRLELKKISGRHRGNKSSRVQLWSTAVNKRSAFLSTNLHPCNNIPFFSHLSFSGSLFRRHTLKGQPSYR